MSSEGIFVQRTLTVWESEQAMKDYGKSGDHIKAMRAFAAHANRSYTAHFEIETVPTWETALDYLLKNGKEHYGRRLK